MRERWFSAWGTGGTLLGGASLHLGRWVVHRLVGGSAALSASPSLAPSTLSAVSLRRTFCELPKFLSPMFFCKIGMMLLASSYSGLRIKRDSINKNAVPTMWLPLFSFGFVLSSLKAVNANILSGPAAVSLALLFDLCRKSD